MSSAAGCTSSRLSAVASATNAGRSCCGARGVLELLIERIDLAPDGISVTLHAAGLAASSRSWRARRRPLWPRPNPCWRQQSNDWSRESRGGHSDHPHPDAAAASRWPEADHDTGGAAAPAPKPRRDETLVRALVRAHRWRRRIDNAQARSITDLAEHEGVTVAYVCRLLPLTCLAPDIVEAILGGRQPKGLRLAEMLGNGPLAWHAQREAWSFSN